MTYKKSITDILQGFIDSLNYTVTIYQITPLAGGKSWLLSVNDVMHAQVGFQVTIGGINYKIIAVDDTDCANTITISGGLTPIILNGTFEFENTGILTQPAGSIVITGGTTTCDTGPLANFPYTGNLIFTGGINDVLGPNLFAVEGGTISFPPSATTFNMYQVRFFHGTAKQTGEEITAGMNLTTAYPMLWLWDDQINEKFNEDPEDPIERASTLKLFFLTNGMLDDKRAEALEDTYVKPMRKFKENFMNIVNDPFSGVQTWEQTDADKVYSQFTITYTIKGESKNLWGATLSGIGIDIVLKFYKQSPECCC